MSKHGLVIEGVEFSDARRTNLRMPERHFAANVKEGEGGKKVGEILMYDIIGAGWFGDGITAKQVESELKNLADVDELHVFINSPGGSVLDALGIYNALVRHPAKVVTQNVGAAWSSAGWILQAGDERLMSEIATVMVHNTHNMVFGDRRALLKEAEAMEKSDENIALTFSKRTGRKVETFRNLMDKETWFTAAEALENKLIDGLIPAKSGAANLDPRAFGYNVRAAHVTEVEAEEPTSTDDDTEIDIEPSGVTEVDVRMRLLELETG